jgi:uncharacterized protein YcbX
MNLSEINIYPIKSCRGISLAEAVVEERGLQFDRRWMLVDENNRFLTQREYPVMATIGTSMDSGQLTVDNLGNQIRIPPAEGQSRRAERVQIWSSKVQAAVHGDEVNRFFSDVMGAKVRLVAMTEARRPVNYWYRIHQEDHVSFADGYPFLLIGEGSLEELNRRIADANGGAGESPAFQSIPMNRFRPNLVVKGSEPFAEDTWKKVRIGGTVFHVVKPCARCPIPTIDQETGVRYSSEPTRTLATFRQVRRKGKNKILFGQNLIADEARGTVRVGDQVEVLEYRSSLPSGIQGQ